MRRYRGSSATELLLSVGPHSSSIRQMGFQCTIWHINPLHKLEEWCVLSTGWWLVTITQERNVPLLSTLERSTMYFLFSAAWGCFTPYSVQLHMMHLNNNNYMHHSILSIHSKPLHAFCGVVILPRWGSTRCLAKMTLSYIKQTGKAEDIDRKQVQHVRFLMQQQRSQKCTGCGRGPHPERRHGACPANGAICHEVQVERSLQRPCSDSAKG